jgi:hypothetical protein
LSRAWTALGSLEHLALIPERVIFKFLSKRYVSHTSKEPRKALRPLKNISSGTPDVKDHVASSTLVFPENKDSKKNLTNSNDNFKFVIEFRKYHLGEGQDESPEGRCSENEKEPA